jgi:hypothetical protein
LGRDHAEGETNRPIDSILAIQTKKTIAAIKHGTGVELADNRQGAQNCEDARSGLAALITTGEQQKHRR